MLISFFNFFKYNSIKIIKKYIYILPSPLSGEVYVLDDGGEVDLDLGNYERFLDITLHRDNNITTGKIYKLVIEKERTGEYLGKTVQGNFPVFLYQLNNKRV